MTSCIFPVQRALLVLEFPVSGTVYHNHIVIWFISNIHIFFVSLSLAFAKHRKDHFKWTKVRRFEINLRWMKIRLCSRLVSLVLHADRLSKPQNLSRLILQYNFTSQNYQQKKKWNESQWMDLEVKCDHLFVASVEDIERTKITSTPWNYYVMTSVSKQPNSEGENLKSSYLAIMNYCVKFGASLVASLGHIWGTKFTPYLDNWFFAIWWPQQVSVHFWLEKSPRDLVVWPNGSFLLL